MVEFCVYRRGGLLVPVSASDEADIKRLPQRVVMSVETKPRAPAKVARWYRAAVQLIVEATGHWPNREAAHEQLMLECGFYSSLIIRADGTTKFNPQSTADWSYVEWREFLDRVLPKLLLLAGESRPQFVQRVNRFFGITLKEIMDETDR